jgi:hypothetical protein
MPFTRDHQLACVIARLARPIRGHGRAKACCSEAGAKACTRPSIVKQCTSSMSPFHHRNLGCLHIQICQQSSIHLRWLSCTVMSKKAPPTSIRRTRIQANAVARKAERQQERISARAAMRRGLWIRMPFFLFFLALCVDGFFSETAIITPLNPTAMWVVRLSGVIIGIVLIPASLKYNSDEPSKIGTVMCCLGLPLMCAAVAELGAWRVYNHASFAFSNAPYGTAYYPVQSLTGSGWDSRGTRWIGRSYQVLIDPYDAGSFQTSIRIPRWQYDQFVGERRALCIAVQERISSAGPIQIISKGDTFFYAPEPQDIRVCAL